VVRFSNHERNYGAVPKLKGGLFLTKNATSFIVTTDGDKTDGIMIHQASLKPGTPFLQKPFSPMELARKVREVLDG